MSLCKLLFFFVYVREKRIYIVWAELFYSAAPPPAFKRWLAVLFFVLCGQWIVGSGLYYKAATSVLFFIFLNFLRYNLAIKLDVVQRKLLSYAARVRPNPSRTTSTVLNY